MSVYSVGMELDAHDSVLVRASRSEESACLTIGVAGVHCEIGLRRTHLEALRDQLPDVFAGLDRWVAEEDRCGRAQVAHTHAQDTATRALALAVAAEANGDHDLAAALRAAAADATSRADAVSEAIVVFAEAAVDADLAADDLCAVIGKAQARLNRA